MGSLFEVSGLGFSYPGIDSGRVVIDNITFLLQEGCFYGIIGPNGCGKTTLIDLLMGQLTSSGGKVCFRGRDISALSPRERARQMALVPQLYSINFPFTGWEVVAMGRYPYLSRFSSLGVEDARIITETMKATDTLRFSRRRVNQLSGGERQRVIFARALAQHTAVIFLDEATANLDINHTLALLRLAANRVAAGGTVISVFQDINLAAMFCDHLLLIESGRCLAFGPTRAVLTEANLNRLFHVECRVEENAFSHHLQVVFRA